MIGRTDDGQRFVKYDSYVAYAVSGGYWHLFFEADGIRELVEAWITKDKVRHYVQGKHS